MFIPYKDDNPTRRFAVITFLMIVINCAAFFFQVSYNTGDLNLTRELALIPVELRKGNLPDSGLISPWLSVITSMFMHGGVSHLLFNMLFLWIFGNNIEDVMTRPRFVAFYIITGAVGALAFSIQNPMTDVSLIGASGAVSGILGAYLFLFPMAKVRTLVLIFPIRMPAFIFIVLWFITQISGLLDGGGNVAWATHIAGFVSGAVLHRFFMKRR